MFCSKCHTYIKDDSMKFCSRCGNELTDNKTSKFSSFKPSINKFNSTFRSTIKSSFKPTITTVANENEIEREHHDNTNISQENTIGMTHDEQAAYSRQYSGLNKDPRMTHDQQAAYSRKYSNLNKDPRLTHDEQAAYSRKYSNLNKNPHKSHDEQYNYSIRYSYNDTSSITSDNDYRKYFIGQNANEIMKLKFSLPGFIFGPLYLIYRKMYVLGIFLQLFIFIALYNLGSDANILIQFLINIAIGTKANLWYINYTNKKIQSIKNNNPDKSSSELVEIIAKQGGTIPIKTFFILLIILYITTQVITGIYEINTNEIKKVNNNYSQDIKLTKTIENYQYEIPKELSQKVDYKHLQSYTYNDIENDCVFVIESQPNDLDAKEYLQNQSNNVFNEYNSANIYVKKVNDIYWYYQQLDTNNLSIYKYATSDNSERILTLITTTYEQTNNKCKILSEEIINSFKRY